MGGILLPDGTPAQPSAAPLDVLSSVLEQMHRDLVQESSARITDAFGYDNPGYGGHGYGRYGDDIHGTQWGGGDELSTGFPTEEAQTVARRVGRDLWKNNEFAINGHQNRISYIIGTGHTYTVVKKKSSQATDDLVALMQMRVDEFLVNNRWMGRQQENVLRKDRDGEVFLRKFERDGRLIIRSVEPSAVYTPDTLVGREDITFGIRTDPLDVEEVISYFIDEAEVPASDIQHRKGVVDSNVKRGCPLFWAVRYRLAHAQKLLVNMARTSDTQTAIAMIRRHQGMTASGAEKYKKDFLDKLNATGNIPTQSAGHENVALYTPGSIIDSSQKTEYEFPNQGLDASRYVQVLQAVLRAVASMVQQPEFMFTSDASNANLASTLVAEGPAVKRFQRDQAIEKEDDLELIWEDIEMGVGTLYDESALQEIEIKVGVPDVNVRDRKSEADVNSIYNDMRIKSPQTISGELGLDYEQEQKNFEEAEPELPPLTVTPEPPAEEPRPPATASESLTLEHTPGGHDHQQKRHGNWATGTAGPEQEPKHKPKREPRATERVLVPESPSGGYVTVHTNPTMDQAESLIARTQMEERRDPLKFAGLRALSDGRNIWIWKAREGTHDMLADKLGLPYKPFEEGGLLTLNTENNVRYIFTRYDDTGSYLEDGKFIDLDEEDKLKPDEHDPDVEKEGPSFMDRWDTLEGELDA